MSGRFRSSGISGRRNIENPGAKTEVYFAIYPNFTQQINNCSENQPI